MVPNFLRQALSDPPPTVCRSPFAKPFRNTNETIEIGGVVATKATGCFESHLCNLHLHDKTWTGGSGSSADVPGTGNTGTEEACDMQTGPSLKKLFVPAAW